MRADIAAEYERWRAVVGDDPQRSDYVIGADEVLRAHFLLVDHFAKEGEGLGGVGPKSVDLLHSAVARQSAGYGNVLKWTSPFEVVATLFYGLISNHAFQDANKRTALLVALFHLLKIKRYPKVKQKEFEELAIRVAARKLELYPNYRKFEKYTDPEVRFIADFFRSRTREIDGRIYLITFNELQRILNRFGFELSNPHGNYIDVVKVETRTVGLFKKKTEVVRSKVAQIGFPGWKEQVSKNALRTVRDETGLTSTNGIDSQSKPMGGSSPPIHRKRNRRSEPARACGGGTRHDRRY